MPREFAFLHLVIADLVTTRVRSSILSMLKVLDLTRLNKLVRDIDKLPDVANWRTAIKLPTLKPKLIANLNTAPSLSHSEKVLPHPAWREHGPCTLGYFQSKVE